MLTFKKANYDYPAITALDKALDAALATLSCYGDCNSCEAHAACNDLTMLSQYVYELRCDMFTTEPDPQSENF